MRRAVVVENIGRVTCICSDKTGTIPEGRLRLSHRVPAGAEDAEFLLQLAAAASRSESGDPMDVAILDALPQPLPWETVATFPFTEDRKRETGVLRRDGQVSWMPCRRAALRASASSRSPGIMRGRRLPSRARSGSAAARSSRSPATE